ncbi:F-box protein CPR1-like protein [Tanacetum coccineum]
MSDNIPFEIQMEIMKWLPVKPLIQFRSVSKLWKSVIDSSDFINGYGARHTQPHSLILRYESCWENTSEYIYLVDDDIETFKVQQKEFAVSPLLKRYPASDVVGACHGLLCLFAYHLGYDDGRVVIWNPSIQKSVGIFVLLSLEDTYIGFGVCPITRDPTVVNVYVQLNKPWHKTFANDGEVTTNHMVVSFDMITKEFKVVGLPHNLTNELLRYTLVYVSKLRGSLVVYGDINADEALCCGVWMMENDSSFRKLFTIGAHVSEILGFSKSGETIFVIRTDGLTRTTLNVYDPYSQQIKNLEISGAESSFDMGSYKESLLLLDHSDLHIYRDVS